LRFQANELLCSKIEIGIEGINMKGRPGKTPEHYFGVKLREFRKSLKLNQSQFAIRWGVDRSDLSRYELYVAPSLEAVKRLNYTFGINAFNWVSNNQLPVSTQQNLAA
jgi:DNA-binding XRE family transcriptional regulator